MGSTLLALKEEDENDSKGEVLVETNIIYYGDNLVGLTKRRHLQDDRT